MTETFDAQTSVRIHAPSARVWEALTRPELIRQYLHGTNTTSDWKVGSKITWKGEWKGKQYEDKGTVLEVEPNRLLKTTHWSPMSGAEDKPENYHTVTYALAENDGWTTVTLTQSNNPSQAAAEEMAKSSWDPILKTMKEMLEK